MIATGRPARPAASRTSVAVSACVSCDPWLKFSRATSMPASTIRTSTSGSREAGPIVATIFVRRSIAADASASARGPVRRWTRAARRSGLADRARAEQAAEDDEPGAGDDVDAAHQAVADVARARARRRRSARRTSRASRARRRSAARRCPPPESVAPAVVVAAKTAAHEAIVSGFDAVAANAVANARRGVATSSSVSPPSRTRNARAASARRARRARPRRRGRGPARAGRSGAAARRRRRRPPRRARRRCPTASAIARPVISAPRTTERTTSSVTGPTWAATSAPSPRPMTSAELRP